MSKAYKTHRSKTGTTKDVVWIIAGTLLIVFMCFILWAVINFPSLIKLFLPEWSGFILEG